MDGVLMGGRFLLGDEISLADVAMYSYTAAAPKGGIDLSLFRALRPWLARVEALPRFTRSRERRCSPMPECSPLRILDSLDRKQTGL
jgi:glutathione S-transferase